MNNTEIKSYNNMKLAFINTLMCAMCDRNNVIGEHYRSWKNGIKIHRSKVSDLLLMNVNGECRNMELKAFLDKQYKNIYEDARLYFEKVICNDSQYIKKENLTIPLSPAIPLLEMVDIFGITTDKIISTIREDATWRYNYE